MCVCGTRYTLRALWDGLKFSTIYVIKILHRQQIVHKKHSTLSVKCNNIGLINMGRNLNMSGRLCEDINACNALYMFISHCSFFKWLLFQVGDAVPGLWPELLQKRRCRCCVFEQHATEELIAPWSWIGSTSSWAHCVCCWHHCWCCRDHLYL